MILYIPRSRASQSREENENNITINHRVSTIKDHNLLSASLTEIIFPRIAPIAENARRSVAEDSEV